MIPAVLISVVLAVAAWMYGATEPWALGAIQAGVLLATITALPEAKIHRHGAGYWRRWIWIIPLALLCMFLLVQLWNASHLYSAIDEGLTPRSHIQWLPRSVSRQVTLGALGRLLTYAGVLATVRSAFTTKERHGVLLGLMLLAGFFMALLVIMQRADSPNPPHYATGMFVNENNYAAYANLLLPIALFMGRAAHVRARLRMARSHPGYVYYSIAGVLLVSVLISGSRAGIAISLLVVAAWIGCEAWDLVRSGSWRRIAWMLPGVLIPLALSAGLAFGTGAWQYRDGLQGIDGTITGLAGRLPVLRATWIMFLDRWVAGTGAGTYACAFPYYQPSALWGMYFRYAHNDWLQYLAELGALGGTLLAATILTALIGARRASIQRRSNSRRSLTYKYEQRALVTALGGVCLHALVDFPLHIPSIAVICAAWVGLLWQPFERS